MINIIKHNSYYQITGVKKVPYILENDLSKWNPGYFRKDRIGFWYDEKMEEMRIPAGYPLKNIEQAFPYSNYIEDLNSKSYETINIGLLNYPKDYIQENSLAFMTGNAPFTFTRQESQLYIDLDTGVGKTFLMVATACYFRTKCVVFIPAIEKIGKQWLNTLDKFTTLNRNEYLYVKGSKMCKDIINGKYKGIKVFIIPRSTVLSFVRKFDDDWTMLTRLTDAMEVGIKGVDEAHMDFNTIVNIDCFTNIPKTYYMSSSPMRSDKIEKQIYKKVFRNVPRHGKELKTKEQNHIIPLMIEFKSTPSYEWLKKIKTRYGTSLAKYGDYLLAEDGAREEFIDAYTVALFMLLKFRRRSGKILVLCITIDFAKQLEKITKQMFPYLTTGLFVGSGKEKEKELDNDIVFSTVKSMGTGSEFVNHQHTINTLTYSSEVMADQISGRIRYQEGRKGIYCELINVNHKIARKHYEERLPYLTKKAKDGKVLCHQISDQDINEVMNYFKSGYRFNGEGLLTTKTGQLVLHRIRRIKK